MVVLLYCLSMKHDAPDSIQAPANLSLCSVSSLTKMACVQFWHPLLKSQALLKPLYCDMASLPHQLAVLVGVTFLIYYVSDGRTWVLKGETVRSGIRNTVQAVALLAANSAPLPVVLRGLAEVFATS